MVKRIEPEPKENAGGLAPLGITMVSSGPRMWGPDGFNKEVLGGGGSNTQTNDYRTVYSDDPETQKADVKSFSQIGSGALPLAEIPSIAVCLRSESIPINSLAKNFRNNDPSIIGYVRNDTLFFDLRTVLKDEDRVLLSVFKKSPGDEYIKNVTEQLYESALLLEGSLDDPHKLVNRLNKMLEESSDWYVEVKNLK